ncbi:TonB-dependent receptor [Algoriphagus confluentis]|uniref:TonB-dependent receptor n=1 Tax=Algoriphagus confluentis TaxID=1697556 RepID=A0ABQ6PI50_9BACT|nr:TonB-dependent receptor [Algoriphagus confluentis]
MKKLAFLIGFIFLLSKGLLAQEALLSGKIYSDGKPLPYATVVIKDTGKGTVTDEEGRYSLQLTQVGRYSIQVSYLGKKAFEEIVEITKESFELDINVEGVEALLDEVVVSGTLQEISRKDSPVPVEVYKSSFFQANRSPSLFESFQNINGVRPQVNCSICYTGDIQINGLEGPYTMILIDGMPLVSGLGTVYGLSGIPQSLIDRIEVVKGPASTLYGSEAVAGLINIITKRPENAPLVSADVMGTTWGELNLDLGIRSSLGESVQSLTGINAFYYDNPIDNNGDGLTDLTLQERFSLFQKFQIQQRNGKMLSLAGRYIQEDRWGGELNWTPAFRGGDEIYGESIRTRRWELFGNYQLPVKEEINLQISANGHKQDSYYGDMFYLADQRIGFGQLTWNKTLGKNQLLTGLAYRYTYYDDNTPATAESGGQGNNPVQIHLPGFFVQNEFKFKSNQSLLAGLRYDYNSVHGGIWSPRINYKLSSKDQSLIWRTSIGNGFRVANVFTEDHAALTGARQVVFEEDLDPERSWNINTNLVKKIYTDQGNYFSWDASAFFTQFSNKIIPDYDTNPNQIIYANLDGTSRSQGISLSFDGLWANGLKILTGVTLMDVSFTEGGVRERQLLTERFSGVWTIGYHFHPLELTVDYTGNIYGPMRLPLLGELDDRSEYSPWWSLQNIQVTKSLGRKWEIYGGVKNLLNYTPPANSIARPFDPFDREVVFDETGQAVSTPDNPNALTFDPTYMFAPNQGMRGFLGVRLTLD